MSLEIENSYNKVIHSIFRERNKTPIQHHIGELEGGSEGAKWLMLSGRQGWREEGMPESTLSWSLPPCPTLHPAFHLVGEAIGQIYCTSSSRSLGLGGT